MAVLSLLTDPDVVEKILRHLGLPVSAPALSPARSSPLGFSLPEEESGLYETDRDGDSDNTIVSETVVRPPPGGSASRTGGVW